ncbi:MAG: glycosyltransferase [Pseudomonadota bacterium]
MSDRPPDATRTGRITILLATCNGARHLEAQLGSYLAQEDPRWDLWVSDDGSTDDTRAILDTFRRAHSAAHDIRLFEGPQAGPAANFMALLTRPELPAGPVALSDQDDVWLPQKLSLARATLEKAGPAGPVVYSAQSIYTDPDLHETGRSRPPARPPDFRNALTQNIVSGHSLVLDADALALVRRAGIPQGIPYHDWWLYQVISGAGGRVIVAPDTVLYYRQHGRNAMGAHHGIAASVRRTSQVLGRTYGHWIDANAAALSRISALLTPENAALLDTFRRLPSKAGLRRALAFSRLGLHRQSRPATVGLLVAAGLGWV